MFDGNGNVSALVHAQGGAETARYDYGPFGELLRATGPMARANPFRFSTKFQDEETGWLYYGYRYYDANTGRWLSRDPIEEDGGINIYGFLGNNSLIRVDLLGLWDFAGHLGIGLEAIGKAGVAMTPKEIECFRRGLLLPDLPFFDTHNAATSHDDIPLAFAVDLKLSIDEFIDPAEQWFEKAKDQLWIFDIDDPFTWIGLATKPARERIQYWWGDSSFIGPIATRVPYLKNTDTVRTHWGDLGYHHAMGKTGMDPAQLQSDVVNFVNAKLNAYRDRLCEDPCRAYLELGMALHTLADSWAGGHTIRNSDGKIRLFQDFNGQSQHYHKHHDHLSAATLGNYNSAVAASVQMILQATGESPVDSSHFFQLAPGALVGRQPGTEAAAFWQTLLNGAPNGR